MPNQGVGKSRAARGQQKRGRLAKNYKERFVLQGAIMPKLVCVTCQCELKPETNGTVVVETASFGPYKVWNADTWKCPGCGVEIVAGFCQQPIRQDHYADDFKVWLGSVLRTAERVEYDNERPST